MVGRLFHSPDLIKKVLNEIHGGEKVQIAARNNGVSPSTVRNWIYRGEQLSGLTPKPQIEIGLTPKTTTTARILYYDIETTDLTVSHSQYDLKINQKYLNHKDITRDWSILGIGWKFIGGDTEYLCVSPDDVFNDEYIVKEFYKVLEQADILVGHHSDSFDFKKLYARFMYYRLPPLPPKQMVDTLKMARKIAKVTSNSLSYLCHFFDLPFQKSEPPNWRKIKQGDAEELAYMCKYGCGDVDAGSGLYLFLRAYSTNQPNLAVYDKPKDTEGNSLKTCGNCGSYDINICGKRYMKTKSVDIYRCNECKSVK